MTLFVTSSVAVFGAAIAIVNVYDQIVIENQKRKKICNQRNLYIVTSIRRLGMEFTAF